MRGKARRKRAVVDFAVHKSYGAGNGGQAGTNIKPKPSNDIDMKSKYLTPLAALALAVTLHAEPAPAPSAPAKAAPSDPAEKPAHPAFADSREKVSYSLGMTIAEDMKKQGLDINPDALAAGFKDTFTGAQPRLTAAERKATLMAFQQEMTAKLLAEQRAAGEQARKESAEFLAANKAREGVKTTPSGLQYKVLVEGKGAQPKPTDTVTVNYKGTLVNGKVFDSSYDRGQPATFPVNQVIKGWAEALPMMKTGSKWQIVIPADLAYGDHGVGKDIPPNATLIFEVELLGVKS
jgi:FKBP-type peptidyl-prolyl cis-trans isomerase FklB